MLNLMNSAKLNETLPCPLSKSEVLDEFVGVATDAVVDGVAKVLFDVVLLLLLLMTFQTMLLTSYRRRIIEVFFA